MINETRSIHLLFPVLNERLRLRNGIEKTIEYLKENVDIPYILTILDNGSDDETPTIGQELEAQYPEVKYVRLTERGVGIAFREGIRRNESDIVGYMDIDLSTDLKYLGKTIELFGKRNELQYVNGSRFHKDSDTKGRKWYRRITSMGLVFLLKAIFHMKATDALCGFTFLRKEAARQLLEECSKDNGWFYTVEFLLRAERDGMEIYEMPVEWQEDYNTTVKVFKTIINYLIQICRLYKTFRNEKKQKKIKY